MFAELKGARVLNGTQNFIAVGSDESTDLDEIVVSVAPEGGVNAYDFEGVSLTTDQAEALIDFLTAAVNEKRRGQCEEVAA